MYQENCREALVVFAICWLVGWFVVVGAYRLGCFVLKSQGMLGLIGLFLGAIVLGATNPPKEK